MTHSINLSRRGVLSGLTLAASASLLWACVDSGEGEVEVKEDLDQLLARICDIVLPATSDGPGASDVGTHKFVALALAHGLAGTEQPASPDVEQYQDWLNQELRGRVGGDFMSASLDRQTDVVRSMDLAAFADRAAPTPWIKIKHLILIGYYTSEAGGAEVLRYEDVPGEFIGDVEILPNMKALSNDWTAVKYG